ncbi:MAG: hypothetical protein KGQ66_08045, partial [Acidobacteriota bacterium]|nr:hypothetical protein [Acidobacteriota bacterium]
MTTCTWNFRRHAGRITAAAVAAALTSGLLVPSASADQMSSLQAQAAALTAKITNLGRQVESLAEQYDQAQYQLGQLRTQEASAQKTLSASEAAAGQARQALKSDAIAAYVTGGTTGSAAGSSVQSANDSLLRAEYVNTLATNQSEDVDRYRLATLQEQVAQSQLQKQESAVSAQLDSLTSARQAVSASQAELISSESQVNNEIAQLRAQEQAAAAAAAAAAA